MRHWFLGDSVIVRYRDDVRGERVRITADWVGEDDRRYRVVLIDPNGKETSVEFYPNLAEALQCGEKWIP